MIAVNAANAIKTDVAKAETALKRFNVVFMTVLGQMGMMEKGRLKSSFSLMSSLKLTPSPTHTYTPAGRPFLA